MIKVGHPAYIWIENRLHSTCTCNYLQGILLAVSLHKSTRQKEVAGVGEGKGICRVTCCQSIISFAHER